jgi:hypothetical protein
VLLLAPAPICRGGGPVTSTFTVASGPAETGDVVVRPVTLAHGGSGLAGWSLGVCHPPELLELLSVVEGTALLTAKNGGVPDFHQVSLLADGFTSGVLICLTGCATLPPGPGHLLYHPSYEVVGIAPAEAALELCGTLNDPVVPVVVVLPGGGTEVPGMVDGAVSITGPPPVRYALDIDAATALYDTANGVAAAAVAVTLVEEPSSAGAPNPITGFALAIGHTAGLASALGALPGSGLELAGGGAGPDTFLVDTLPGGIVISATIPASPPWLATAPQELVTISYASVPITLMFNPFGLTVPLAAAPALTSPPTAPEVQSPTNLPIAVLVAPGSIAFVPREQFRRGDANGDGVLDISDPVGILLHLFAGGAISCLDAADANDDGALDIADPLALLGHFFSGLPPPPPPRTRGAVSVTGAGPIRTPRGGCARCGRR